MKDLSWEGVIHTFPDDATDDEIAQALGGKSTGSQADVRRVDNLIQEQLDHAKSLKERGVSSREKKMGFAVMLTPEERMADEAHDKTLANFDELEKEIKNAKDPAVKELLIKEHGRIKASLGSILEPKK